MKEEIVDVVDINDIKIKSITRGEAKDSDILRVVGIFILNNRDEIFLQLRSKDSYRYPLYWDCTGGGHVDSGESYEGSAYRELFEETRIRTDLVFLGKHYIELDDGRKHFIAFFKGIFDGNINIDPVEVERLNAFSKEDINNMIINNEKIHPECLFGIKKYLL